LSLEKAVGIPDAIHRDWTALATIVVRTISTSSVELIARDFFQPQPDLIANLAKGSRAWALTAENWRISREAAEREAANRRATDTLVLNRRASGCGKSCPPNRNSPEGTEERGGYQSKNVREHRL
jgi:hypothetical protein